MNIIEESEADCFTLIDNLLPYLMILSFILGFSILKFIKKNSLKLEDDSLSKKHSRAQKVFENENGKKLF